jgi:23S rRNA-/tRNA-specific pseudouridylate synthase
MHFMITVLLFIFIFTFHTNEIEADLRPHYCNVEQAGITAMKYVSTILNIPDPELRELFTLGSISIREANNEKNVWSKAFPHQILENTQQLRIYYPPRRFPSGDCDWNMRLLFQNDRFIIVNKPSNLPCMAHPSNDIQHLTACVKR